MTVGRYGDRDVLVSGGLKDGETVVSAGAHTVFEGERVSITKPLFAEDNESIGGVNGQLAANGAVKCAGTRS